MVEQGGEGEGVVGGGVERGAEECEVEQGEEGAVWKLDGLQKRGGEVGG